MSDAFELVEPRVRPPLDPSFRPAALANRRFLKEVEESGRGVPLVIALERAEGALSRFETRVFPDGHPRAEANLFYAERVFKFLLWQRGGWRISVGGPRAVGEHIKKTYAPDGSRTFDFHFMGEDVYDQPFTVIPGDASEAPAAREHDQPLGRHLEGCRVGFDLGASDRKASAVVDGDAVYSEEVVWSPGAHTDPEYHYHEILTGLKTAASKMPRLDAIGGSSAGICVDNTVRVASLFRGIPKSRFDRVRSLFPRIQKEMGVPLVVVNDGDVTALAGSMSLEDSGVLGVAMGSSEAAGYVNADGNLTGWLSELAFAPLDYQPDAAVDEWSGDRGVGARYLSQQCVFRLAPAAGIEIPDDAVLAHRLEFVQGKLEAGDEGATKIWETMGVYLGYAVAHYADFYEVKHVLILGRCTSGRGGALLLDGARKVLAAEFPDLAQRINIQLPDERSRRVGQSIAAASLPALDGGNK